MEGFTSGILAHYGSTTSRRAAESVEVWESENNCNGQKEKRVKSRLPWDRTLPACPLVLTIVGALLLCFGAVSVARSADSGASTSDWPQWRGPERTGISQESGLLKQWPKGGPKLLWQMNDIGDGFSTPAVVGTRI